MNDMEGEASLHASFVRSPELSNKASPYLFYRSHEWRKRPSTHFFFKGWRLMLSGFCMVSCKDLRKVDSNGVPLPETSPAFCRDRTFAPPSDDCESLRLCRDAFIPTSCRILKRLVGNFPIAQVSRRARRLKGFLLCQSKEVKDEKFIIINNLLINLRNPPLF